jgi:hypothetical protein
MEPGLLPDVAPERQALILSELTQALGRSKGEQGMLTAKVYKVKSSPKLADVGSVLCAYVERIQGILDPFVEAKRSISMPFHA